MSENLENTIELRRYLLGQVSDENTLNLIEERLLSDKDFFGELEIIENELIEDYTENLLAADELENFKRLFLNSPERREKIRLTRALRQMALEERLKTKKEKNGFFSGWLFSPQAAFVLLVLCVAVVGFSTWWLSFRQNEADKLLADVRALHKNQRSVQARIAGFEYAPFVVLRGAADKDDENQIQRRKIELDLSAAIDKNPTAETYSALGDYYLTEKRFDLAAAQFEKAIAFNPQNAELHANLAAALFEKAKLENTGEKLNNLNKSLAELNKALELNPNLLDAIFNKALVLQELALPKEAIAVWKQYLDKDANSKWADEARKNLREIEGK